MAVRVGLAMVFVVGMAGIAWAMPVEVYSVDGPQDALSLDGWVDELGNKPAFPDDEWVTSEEVAWGGHIPCPADYEGNGCVQVRMTNMTDRALADLYYVADGTPTAPVTSISNYDGWIGNPSMSDAREAFRIDAVGVNTPLVNESMTADGILEPGESWEFVLQDYAHVRGASPAAFGSTGIGMWSSLTSQDPSDLSSGSILVPEPGSAAFAAFGLVALLRRRSRS